MNSFYFCNLCIFVYISGLFIWTRGVLGLICHCDYHCPDDHVNFTCQTNYKCFKTRQFEEGTKNIVERHGCIGNREGEGMFQCRSEKTKFKTPMQLQCCDDQDICNWHLTPTIPQQHIDEYHFNLEKTNGEAPTNNHAQGLALAISISICAMILFIIVAYMGFRCAQIKAKHKSQKKRRFVIPHGTAPVDSMHELLLDGNHSSGTGSGKPQMTQRTIAHQLTFLEEIGRGRFAIVYKTKWKDQFFATKVVRSFDEASWKNELEIFEKCNLSHENVLGYVGGDVLESTPGQEVQRLIISSYHEFGTLHRFLLNHSYDVNVLFRLVYTALSGIVHLHRDFLGSQGKPKLAHRNITSKNIYVKDDLQCCIGDFGLAVAQPEDGPLNLRQNPRLPTSRYMPPDMLADLSRIEMQSFDTFQRGDMYSFGLCLWEMILRYEVKATPEEYSLPYTEYLKKNPNEPEYTEMRRLVTVEKKRCQLPQRYHEDQHSRFLMRLINGCWHEQPTMRVTALRMRASLEKYLQERSKSEGSGESTSSVGTAASLGTASTGLS